MLTIALIALPVLIALALFINGPKYARPIAIGAAVVELALVIFAFVQHHQGMTGLLYFDQSWMVSAGISFSFGLDGISLLLVLLSAIAAPLILWTIDEAKFRNPHIFYGLILLMIGGMIGAFTATDGLIFYVFYELSLIPIYFIILIWSNSERKLAVTMKFFLYTLFGSLFMLIALLYVYQHTADHSFAMESLYRAGRSLSVTEQGLVFGGIFLAFAVKMPIFPFHTWQPSTYNIAPTAGTMLLAAVMLKMATYGVIRLIVPMVPDGLEEYKNWAIGLSVLGILYASGMAIAQKNYKLLIAYSSIAHVGLISAGILSANEQGIQGGLIEMFSHGILAIALFYVYDLLESRFGSDAMHSMGGVREVNPLFAFLFFVIVMGSVALPLTSGFVGEFLLIAGLAKHSMIYAGVAGLTVILSAVYMLRAFQTMMLGSATSRSQLFTALTKKEIAILSVLIFIVVAVGVFPKPLLDLTAGSVQEILIR